MKNFSTKLDWFSTKEEWSIEDIEELLEVTKKINAENERLNKDLDFCVKMLIDLQKESVRSLDWDEEDPFRRNEWFEDYETQRIEAIAAAIREGK